MKNYHKAGCLLAKHGYGLVALPDDWHFANCLAYHDDGRILKVRLMTRMAIDKRHIEEDLYLCFPARGFWFLIPHDELLGIVGDKLPRTLKSDSWKKQGKYSWPKSPWAVIDRMTKYRIGPVRCKR